jgi:hypothetical protein
VDYLSECNEISMPSKKLMDDVQTDQQSPVIPIHRYQVFISSTFRDLQEARQQTFWDVLKIGFIPVGMENFSAMDERGWKTIASTIDQSDYYVLIIAGVYGSKDPDGRSWTQREYEYARKLGVPILAFIRKLSSVQGDMVETGPDRELLDGFIRTVRENHLVEEWTTIDDLRRRVPIALMKQIQGDEKQTRRQPGWYRGPIESILPGDGKHRGRVVARDGGTYPAFVPDIVDAIKRAPDGSTIRIACDYADYGVFSLGSDFDEYLTALADAAKTRRCAVNAIILGTAVHQRQIAQVRPEDESLFVRFAAKKDCQVLLHSFGNRMTELGLPKPNQWTRVEFLRSLVSVGAYYEDLMKDWGINIQIAPYPLPMYLWITESIAIWSISPLEPAERFPTLWNDLSMIEQSNREDDWDEHGYISDDRGHIHRLTQIWIHYKKRNAAAFANNA